MIIWTQVIDYAYNRCGYEQPKILDRIFPS